MDNVKHQYDDEIDLIELFETLWDGKWKIVFIGVISLLCGLGYIITQPPPNFVATTEIKPITSVEAERYTASNSTGFFDVSQSLLQSLYIEQIEERTLFEQAILKYELLNKDDFETESDFNDAVVLLASSILVQSPNDPEIASEGDNKRFWTIEFEYNDEVKWRNVLNYINEFANDAVRKTLKRRFELSLSVAKQKRMFEIEDLNTQINNILNDYDRKISDRLAFLREQAAIARKLGVANNTLGVANNTIEAQSFGLETSLVASLKTDAPFYLRGFDAIEKEIELVEKRENKEAFVVGLLELQQKKRYIEQNKTLERVASLLASTPISTPDDFSAVSVSVVATNFEYKNKKLLILALVALIGGMIGVIYVLISNAIRKRKERLAGV